MDAALALYFPGVDGIEAVAVLAKAMTYASCFVAAGGVFFLRLFQSHLGDSEQAAIRHTCIVAAALCIGLSAMRIAIMNCQLSGEWSDAFDARMTRMVLASAEGLSTEWRVVGLALLLTMRYPRVRNGFLWLPLLGGLMATLSFSVVGHAAALAAASGAAAQCLISTHLLAVAFWLGALGPLHRLSKQKDLARVAALMLEFGKMASIVVAVLIAAGVLLLWQLLGKPEELWQSVYGHLILAKLAGVALLLSLAGINKLRLTPLLRTGDTSAIVVLQKTIVAEMVVAGLILLSTAALTTVTGPPVLD